MLDSLKGNRDAASIGRVALVFSMGLATFFWVTRGALPDGLQEWLYCLLAYNFGGKITGGLFQRRAAGPGQEKLKPDVMDLNMGR